MPSNPLVGVYRAGLALAILAAVVATAADVLSRGPLNIFNFFGFFTIQSNVFLMVVLSVTASFDLRGARHPEWLDLARGLTTTYIVIVGLVYVLLLAPLGAAGGVPVPWANFVLHYVTPVTAAIEWVVLLDRRPLAPRRLVAVLVYPLVWLIVVLIRGATDGWVPYPFLDPANGYGAVAIVCVGICVAMLVVGALVFWVSRARVSRALGNERSATR
ncbi:MAG TPA: Pr6Pr family membrane protein [Trueperaceae bacterium]|nr:Pr6Pr family membrane protein [Trueperaceae bacterium]